MLNILNCVLVFKLSAVHFYSRATISIQGQLYRYSYHQISVNTTLPQTAFFHCIMVFSFQIQAQVMHYLHFLSLQCLSDCVLYYYLTKKSQNFKTLVRRNFGNRRRRNQVFIYFLFTYALFSQSKHRYDSNLCCTFWECVIQVFSGYRRFMHSIHTIYCRNCKSSVKVSC